MNVAKRPSWHTTLTDLIKGAGNRWTGLYDPSRKPLRAAREFARENLKIATAR
jgi:hypothetical protein